MWHGNIFMDVHYISRWYKAHLLPVMSYRLPRACLNNLQNFNFHIMFSSTIALPQNGASFLGNLKLTVDISVWQDFKTPYTYWYSSCTFVIIWKWAKPYDQFGCLLQSWYHFVTSAMVEPLQVINCTDVPIVKTLLFFTLLARTRDVIQAVKEQRFTFTSFLTNHSIFS
jgi:hypothetical protein